MSFAAASIVLLLAPQESPASRARAATSPQSALERAQALESAGDCLGAARIVETVVNERPGDVALRVSLGRLWLRAERFADAERELARAAAAQPANREAWLALGEARFRAQRFRPAIEAFEKAAALGDDDGRAASGVGSSHFSMAERDNARAAFERALKANAQLFAPHHFLGRIALEEERLDDAAAQFQWCVRADPKDSESWFRWGLVLRRQPGKEKTAVAAFRKAVQADPLHLGARQNLAQVLIETGHESEGQAELAAHARLARGRQRLTFATESLKLDPSSAPNRVAVGEALLDLDANAEALAHFREALRAKPGLAAAALGAARACAALGDAKGKTEYARAALESAGANGEIAAAARALLEAPASSRASAR